MLTFIRRLFLFSSFIALLFLPSAILAQSTTSQKVDCTFTMPEKPVYEARIISVKRPGITKTHEVFTTEVYIQNNGNVPWFALKSGCPSMTVNLGTEKKRDHASVFYYSSLTENTGWLSSNRIVMETPRVDPGKMGLFRFISTAPAQDGIYREYYAPVIEGVTWIKGGIFSADVKVGEPNFDINKKLLFPYIEESMDLTKADFAAAEKRKKARENGTADEDVGGKSIEVSISKQRMYLKEDGEVVKEFVVSTGTYKTPTPLGTFKIFQKQPVRVASGKTPWIMNYWMHFKLAYGFHELPALANDNGVYWREALSHIGTRRSHGCIRLLREDAKFAYDWAPIGTPVKIYN